MPKKIALVIPCYNEGKRFVPERFIPLLGIESLTLVLVNDGSTDETSQVLHAMSDRHPGCCRVLDLPDNAGKAEAVRRGLAWAIEAGAQTVGYLDADGATPGEEMVRLIDVFMREGKQVVLAARIAMLGCHIERSPCRHYLGRLFATGAAMTLGCPVYDTQCGAKLFEVTPALTDAVRRPFLGRWSFDVELLGRLIHPIDPAAPPCPPAEWMEVPLKVWRDEPGSKVRMTAMLGMGWELLRVCLALRIRKRAQAHAGAVRTLQRTGPGDGGPGFSRE